MTVSEVFAGVSLRANLPPNLALLTSRASITYSRALARETCSSRSRATRRWPAIRRRCGRAGRDRSVSQSPRPADFPDTGSKWSWPRLCAAREFLWQADERIQVTGITGTNGKTTTGYLVDAVLRRRTKDTALVGRSSII